mmetsp:Transcript_51291/g.166303  ORF Transcript_51291/g.166303 Transcript_51291/m.166303 type:complete len:305 (-) Transcript_51291:417-1331(-)
MPLPLGPLPAPPAPPALPPSLQRAATSEQPSKGKRKDSSKGPQTPPAGPSSKGIPSPCSASLSSASFSSKPAPARSRTNGFSPKTSAQRPCKSGVQAANHRRCTSGCVAGSCRRTRSAPLEAGDDGDDDGGAEEQAEGVGSSSTSCALERKMKRKDAGCVSSEWSPAPTHKYSWPSLQPLGTTRVNFTSVVLPDFNRMVRETSLGPPWYIFSSLTGTRTSTTGPGGLSLMLPALKCSTSLCAQPWISALACAASRSRSYCRRVGPSAKMAYASEICRKISRNSCRCASGKCEVLSGWYCRQRRR